MSMALIALLAGWLASLLLERLVRPVIVPVWHRPPATLLVHLGAWSLAFTALLVVLQRPWFAASFATCLHLVLIQSNHVKWKTLKEPFLVQDFDYFIDMLKYPRLYLPFFGIGLAVTASLAGGMAILLFFWLEPWWLGYTPPLQALSSVVGLTLLALSLLTLGLRRLPSVDLDPASDLARLGMFAFFFAYARLARRPLEPQASPSLLKATPRLPEDARLPNVVVVQSESFFDPRRWSEAVAPDLLPAWDRTRVGSLCHGRLGVPAWGANTVRTEAAFLTGLDETDFGIHRFSPYRALAKQPLPSLLNVMKKLGYRTVAVHPYPAGFYLRDRVLPRLGVDHFIDIEAFDVSERDGQYIGDAALSQRVANLLKLADDEPIFIFVITMENHGPLHLERADAGAAERLSPSHRLLATQPACHDLLVYLRHLQNADAMVDTLCQRLVEAERPGLLCWYGDHVPIMDATYRHLGEPDGSTDYLIWSTQPNAPATQQDLRIEALAERLLQEVHRLATDQQNESRADTAHSPGRPQYFCTQEQ
ncbi:LTA synthase family protein [Billgrantia diversa]|uniref:LTA synthase family protein n=1 Tax=Halomonas sp. MCCC 1A13316 TaxID=2733487 RepID=UPI0018A55DC8|nr:LTA synthase family protein [Halomonas sp. MCCC 1A13316]QOR37453.1 LTA synthase family protein [Halomonas sp. MCCC 1A13316]